MFYRNCEPEKSFINFYEVDAFIGEYIAIRSGTAAETTFRRVVKEAALMNGNY